MIICIPLSTPSDIKRHMTAAEYFFGGPNSAQHCQLVLVVGLVIKGEQSTAAFTSTTSSTMCGAPQTAQKVCGGTRREQARNAEVDESMCTQVAAAVQGSL